jgi:hypothetical protein
LRFTGTFMGHTGAGQPVDFIATGIVRVRTGRITGNRRRVNLDYQAGNILSP